MEERAKKLYRSRTNKTIFGLCGGLGRYFNVDPNLVRILFVLLAALNGVGILVYFVASFVIPLQSDEAVDSEDGEKKSSRSADKHKHGRMRLFLGAAIIAIGLFLLVREFLPLYRFGMFFWPVLLILFGIYLLVKHR